MAVEYEISSDVATIKDVAPNTQVARVASLYSGQITYDDEAGSKFATATIDGKSQRVMLCIAVNGTVNYDDVPSLYSTVDGHRCLNIVAPTETGTPDDVPSVYETVVIDGMNVRAVRCILINETPIYDGVSSTCTFVANGKTHTAQLVNKITGGSVEVIVKGVSPLSLPDAIANSLSYVKAFGGTEQNGTPTPDTPVDIVSNNGVLKARHQSGLPLGYTLLDYIESDGTQYIDTGIKLDSTDKVRVVATTGEYGSGTRSKYFFGVYDTTYGFGYNYNHIGATYPVWANVSSTPITDFETEANTQYDIEMSSGGVYVNGSLKAGVSGTFTGDKTAYLLWANGTGQEKFIGKLHQAQIWKAGTLTRNFVPAQHGSDIGMYDLVSGQFFTNAGTGDFVAGTAVSDPAVVYADGTVETINAHGKNLFDQSTATRYKTSWSNSGDGGYWQAVSSSSEAVTYGSYVKPNTTYTLSKKGGGRLIITGYRTKTEPSSSQTTPADYKIKTDTTLFVDGSYTFTTPADCTWILFGLRQNNSTPTFPYDVQLEQGSTATEYQPYFDGGTATAEMLLKVGDYQDVQSIIDGVVTRNVGVLVFDGTETWEDSGTVGANSHRFSLPIDSTDNASSSLCTHISRIIQNSTSSQSDRPCIRFRTQGTGIHVYTTDNTTTLTQWKQFLADQYAAGTPVTVICPLAQAVTEQVAPQVLNVQTGDNVLEITQASLNGLELEAQYQAAVSLTIQEVEDANLDPNVEVTIN